VTAIEIPEFARTAARRELAPTPPLRPSNALDGADVLPLNGGGLSQREGELLLVGRLTHALLQHLPHCARERRPDAARRFLSLRASQLSDSRRAEIARQALAVMEDDALAPLFGPASAAEVDIVARIMTPKGELPIAGRVDRLAETEHDVFIADFKSGRPHASCGPEHLRQLALYRAAVGPLYPGKRVRCVLVFTQDASVAEPSEEAMDAALRAILDAA
jgi:ATP-dependent helicase/nuclease subunit A